MVYCYLATRPQVEDFRDQDFVLPEVRNLRVQSFVASIRRRIEHVTSRKRKNRFVSRWEG